MGFVYLVLIAFVAMTVVYLLLSVYAKSVRRERLENAWAEDHPDGGDPAARATFIEAGMAAYKSSLRPKLILLVYVIPVIFVGVVHYLTSY